jgi:lipoyl-dependent peroxiredoxin
MTDGGDFVGRDSVEGTTDGRINAMATTRTATTQWKGALLNGSGTVSLDTSGVGTFDVSWASRAEVANGKTSPEELIAAAHSSCFSMALSHGLAGAGTPPESLQTSADVTFQPGEGITGIVLTVKGHVPGLTAEQFQEAAETAKVNCPVSKALTGTTITLKAELL